MNNTGLMKQPSNIFSQFFHIYEGMLFYIFILFFFFLMFCKFTQCTHLKDVLNPENGGELKFIHEEQAVPLVH